MTSAGVSLITLATTFFRLGATTFGGMWAATEKLDRELVQQRGWLTSEDLQFLLIAATLIPAPKFMGLGGLIGYRLRGSLGSAIAVFCLVIPGALIVLALTVLVSPDLLAGTLAPVKRSVGVAVIGILLGSSGRQLQGARLPRRDYVLGLVLFGLVMLAVIAGVHLLAVLVGAFAIGPLLIRGGKAT